MPLAGQTASARNTLSQKPAARCLPHPRAFVESLRLRQTRGIDVAGQAPRTPPCPLLVRAGPAPGRGSHRLVWGRAPAQLPPRGTGRKAPLLGRAPWAFGYGYYLRVAGICIICFTFCPKLFTCSPLT